MKNKSKKMSKLTWVLSVALCAMSCTFVSCSGTKDSQGRTEENSGHGNSDRDSIENISASNGSSQLVDEDHGALALTKTFSNSIFSIDYPEGWKVDGEAYTNEWDVTTLVEISDPTTAEDQYTPNLRVLTVPEKVTESTQELAEGAWYQVQHEGYYVELLDISGGLLNGVDCAILEYVIEKEHGPMRVSQFMLKTSDDTSYSLVGQTNFDNDSEFHTITNVVGTFKLK